MKQSVATFWKPLCYGLLNIVSASGIVFANKVWARLRKRKYTEGFARIMLDYGIEFVQ